MIISQHKSMKIRRIEHIGIACEDKSAAKNLFEQLMNRPFYKEEHVDSEHVDTLFMKFEHSKIELLNATNENSAIARFINKKGEGMHHIAFEVENINDAFDYFIELGLKPLNDQPKKGADNKLIFFLHPKDTNGVLLEFCQEII